MGITVELLAEAGYIPALMGMASSFKDPAHPRGGWWTEEVYEKAQRRAKRLAPKGLGHNKFLESMDVWLWVVAPRCWWQEADTYRLTTKQSESTMHTIMKRYLTQADFDVELPVPYLNHLNGLICDKEFLTLKKLLPEGYLQGREWKVSYKVLMDIFNQRAKHRLPEWRSFCRQVSDQIGHPEYLPEVSVGGEDIPIPSNN